MEESEVNKFDKFYEEHLSALKFQGKTQKTIDVCSRAIRRVRDYFLQRLHITETDNLFAMFYSSYFNEV